ncbi:hypothetical protein BH10CHL1_BH10CHL1_09730 [soil metagenome]
MTNHARYPSYVNCVARVLSNSLQPLSVDTLISHIEHQRPITKGARRAVYRAIGQLFQAVPVTTSHYGWLSCLLKGNTFRHPLTNDEARKGYLLLDELEHAVFFPQFFQTNKPDERKLQIELMGGVTIEAEACIERRTWSLRLGQDFVEWIEQAGGQGRDDVLIKANDAIDGHYMLRLQPREIRDNSAIQNRNIQLALMAEEIVSKDRSSRTAMPAAELAARLIGRGFFKEPTPADDLHYVLHQYSLLRFRQGQGYSFADDDTMFVPDRRNLGGVPRHVSDQLTDFTTAGPDEFNHEWGELLAEMPEGELTNEFGDLLENSCASYEAYLDSCRDGDETDEPLSHSDFHLLEAELETLISLEYEFGYLLPEQQARKEQLAAQLYINPDTLLDDDSDLPDYPDEDDSPFWEN